MNDVIRQLFRFIATNRLIIIAFSALIIYYELKSYRNCFCENKKVFLESCEFSNNHIKENLSNKKSKTENAEINSFVLSVQKLFSIELLKF